MIFRFFSERVWRTLAFLFLPPFFFTLESFSSISNPLSNSLSLPAIFLLFFSPPPFGFHSFPLHYRLLPFHSLFLSFSYACHSLLYNLTTCSSCPFLSPCILPFILHSLSYISSFSSSLTLYISPLFPLIILFLFRSILQFFFASNRPLFNLSSRILFWLLFPHIVSHLQFFFLFSYTYHLFFFLLRL